MLESARYWIAVMLFVSFPPAFLYWFSIHPLVDFWRRFRPGWIVTLHLVGMAVMLVYLLRFRDAVTTVDYGLNYWTIAGAALVLIATGWLQWHRRKLLGMRTLAGVPELDKENPGKLLTEGVYSYVRHPRYIEIAGATLGYALFANYLVGYVVFAFVVFAVIVLVPIEERELEERFGEPYREYRSTVPRFFPKFGKDRR